MDGRANTFSEQGAAMTSLHMLHCKGPCRGTCHQAPMPPGSFSAPPPPAHLEVTFPGGAVRGLEGGGLAVEQLLVLLRHTKGGGQGAGA